MARPIMVSREGVVSSFQLDRVERRSLYGIRRRVPVDASGEPCSRAALTDDGTVLLRSGMTAQGWFLADGRQVESDAIGAQDDDGQPLELVPSTLGEPQELEGPVEATEVLDLAVSSIYRLEPENLDPRLELDLKAGELWRFRFNYRPDYRCETAFLLANEEGFFALVGVPCPPRFLSFAAPPPPDEDDDAEELDFEML